MILSRAPGPGWVSGHSVVFKALRDCHLRDTGRSSINLPGELSNLVRRSLTGGGGVIVEEISTAPTAAPRDSMDHVASFGR